MRESDGGVNGRLRDDTLRSADKQRELVARLGEILSSRGSREEIRAVVRPFCAQARSESMDAAEFVKMVKQSFADGGLAITLAHAGERQQALDRIISICIDEYYAGG